MRLIKVILLYLFQAGKLDSLIQEMKRMKIHIMDMSSHRGQATDNVNNIQLDMLISHMVCKPLNINLIQVHAPTAEKKHLALTVFRPML